jgi:hypothetical protein
MRIPARRNLVDVDPAGTFARVRFLGNPGPGGSRIDGAIKFTYADGTSTYRGSKKVKYDSTGAFGSRAQEDQHLALIRRNGVNESTYRIYCYTDYRSTPPAPQGFWVSMSIWQTLPSASLASPDKPIRWSPECNCPVSGNLNLGVSALMASTSNSPFLLHRVRNLPEGRGHSRKRPNPPGTGERGLYRDPGPSRRPLA